MAVSWTTEQQQVIDLRKRNILVSAAAGSGKTAVLVERIKSMITDSDDPVDIDRLLIVTFTNAAAAEMRERIGAAIEKAIEEDPDNEHLQRQSTLLHNAQITTIDSFCLYVIRNHFHEIDIEPAFRVADEGELKLLKEDVLDALLEERYKEGREEFKALSDGYASGRSDKALSEMVLKLYTFSMSYPWPIEWLTSCVKDYDIDDASKLDGAVWLKPVVANIRNIIADLASYTEQAIEIAISGDGPEHYENALISDRDKYRAIAEQETFLGLYKAITSLNYDKLPSKRGYDGDPDKSELVKEMRNAGKKQIEKLKKDYFATSPQVMAEQLKRTAQYADELIKLTIDFSEAFAAEKRRKNLVDFNDMEHFALDILVDRETKEVRRTAEEFRDMYEEIMIDEYQDSNQVQETILTAISREARGQNNIFMVGDVKQSIYRFRLARPELFMEKFDSYSLNESDRQRIDLHKNFRSRDEVLSFTNDIFYRIMGRDLGNVVYDDKAALYTGALYETPKDPDMNMPEVIIADSADELIADTDYQDKKILEAKVVADRINELMKYQLVTDKKSGELRPIKYSDIVILLRSLTGWADRFAEILSDNGIPAYTLSATGYFSATEVQTVLSMLRILDNPRQDIPLAAVLRSPIAGFKDEELAKIRMAGEGEQDFCECVLDAAKNADKDSKLGKFYDLYSRLRRLVPETPIHELIEIILKETGYGEYAAAMPAGERRYANLMMLIEKAIDYERTSYKGLFHFVRYIDELQKYDVDFGEADEVSENEDVVRIMSIHKSKGLEFPVVFVSGLGKKFNKRDLSSHLVMHPDFGIGLDYMDGERRIKSTTIAKRCIAKSIDMENLGEELRILYVALTRAKEKLILTGTMKKDDVAKALGNASRQAGQQDLLPYRVRQGASGYLDWILPALSAGMDDSSFKFKIAGAAELVEEEIDAQMSGRITREKLMREIDAADDELVGEYDARFSYIYPYMNSKNRKNKYSVSELKSRLAIAYEEPEEETETLYKAEEIVPYVPSFARESDDVGGGPNKGALRGTAFHRIMEKYSFASGEEPREQIKNMAKSGVISQEIADIVWIPDVEKAVLGELGERMRDAEKSGRLYREKAFVMGFTDVELAEAGFPCEDDSEELTLIQGIIDAFWIEDDGIVLLDYKTDRVESAQELKDMYSAQIKLYAAALDKIYAGVGKSAVKECMMYSTRLGIVKVDI
jgi:ATP-dependent helicase/nuclease subunit A